MHVAYIRISALKGWVSVCNTSTPAGPVTSAPGCIPPIIIHSKKTRTAAGYEKVNKITGLPHLRLQKQFAIIYSNYNRKNYKMV